MPVTWRLVERLSSESLRVFEGTDGSGTWVSPGEESQPLYNYRADVKWDGCTNYFDFANGYGWDHDCGDACSCCAQTLHICDLAAHIADVQALQAAVVADGMVEA
jgi:hypothetical protein